MTKTFDYLRFAIFLSFEGLQKSFRAYLLLSELLELIISFCTILCKKVYIRRILQRNDYLARFCQKNCYLARFWQKNGYLESFWQKSGYLASFWQKKGYLASFWQNEWLSSQILAEPSRILQDNHSKLTGVVRKLRNTTAKPM